MEQVLNLTLNVVEHKLEGVFIPESPREEPTKESHSDGVKWEINSWRKSSLHMQVYLLPQYIPAYPD